MDKFRVEMHLTAWLLWKWILVEARRRNDTICIWDSRDYLIQRYFLLARRMCPMTAAFEEVNRRCAWQLAPQRRLGGRHTLIKTMHNPNELGEPWPNFIRTLYQTFSDLLE